MELTREEIKGICDNARNYNMSAICSCQCTLNDCEENCSKYYHCNNVAHANDILADYEKNQDETLNTLLMKAEYVEDYISEEEGTTTLYFSAPVALLDLLLGESFAEADHAMISLEFPKGHQEVTNTFVMLSPADQNGTAYDWRDADLHASDIEKLFAIANPSHQAEAYALEYFETYSRTYEVRAHSRENAETQLLEDIGNGYENGPEECIDAGFVQEEKLIDGVTSCCGYDFGTDLKSANFCPICGKRLIKDEL